MIKIIKIVNNQQYRKKVMKLACKLHPKWFDSVAISKTIPEDLINHHLILATKNDRLVGFLTYNINSNQAEISWMGVEPHNFNQGIGTKLLNKLEKELVKENIRTVIVETLDSKTKYAPYNKTRAFYLKSGFVKTRVKKNIARQQKRNFI